ncbi:DegT/DnrJ/EryC1/StrS family aminotransferase [Paracrocinitomix mangrovi]|uniref:DegT/DnrJ/EryC1/StrS family aminotransferase n=1 Tax=Paracrocinitomix mangrovi TaxID=2862509 RepID=UPI001C8E6EFA|nr:DegT/DnrJ/EryC1/StrS family aminotransferase [Paracrocinitomix mangrovi]UKN03329.1 DegT/DnrJ/EryC1/StrS family aminotransferase [Paracrocinitomix mangrovi]
MKQIQMVDLKTQYEEIKSEVDRAVIDVIASSAFVNGPDVKAFQSELESYLDVKHVIPCANGTDALQIALMALDLKPGDEVITSDFTFAATVEVVGLLQLKHVLVDVDPDTFNISLEAIEAAITPKTRVIIPVHLFGQAANMEEILALANKHNIHVVEDNAQAIGGSYTFSNGVTKKNGTMGVIGTTSFFPSKNLGCYGDGGAIFTNNDEIAVKIRSIVNHGMGERYHYERLGVNSRLDSIQAAVLRIKLRKLDEYIAKRQAAAQHYNEFFSQIDGVTTPALNPKADHVFHQYTLKIEGLDQFKLQNYLNEQGIPAMIYYPIPLHSQEAYEADRYNDEDFAVTNSLCKQVISLPMHTELDKEQLDYICDHLKKYLSQN